MFSYTDLKKGVLFVWNGDPYEVVESQFLRMQQRKAVVQTRIKNLITGKVLERNWQPSDSVEEAEIEKREATFIYSHKEEFWFHEKNDPKKRFSIAGDIAGESAKFLKGGDPVTIFEFKDKIIRIVVPVKAELKVIEAPPSIKGNTAQGGTKVATLEGGAVVSVPLFIEEGDIVRVNTETGQYTERVEKNG